MCAVKNGVCYDTTMGITPLEGLVMGTRSGDLDPALPFYIMRKTGMSADEMDIAVGAGSIRVENITSRDLSVETGAGKVTLNGVNADEMDLDVGVGHAYVEGNVTQELDVECGMGSAQLKLNGEERDFNYDIECAAGSIHVGTQTYSALASDKYVNNSALKECSLKCSMGSIQVSFTK